MTIAYNMNGCFKFYTFIFFKSQNLAKYRYGLSSLEQHHKIFKNFKNTLGWYIVEQDCRDQMGVHK
jgi:hypothetical protein